MLSRLVLITLKDSKVINIQDYYYINNKVHITCFGKTCKGATEIEALKKRDTLEEYEASLTINIKFAYQNNNEESYILLTDKDTDKINYYLDSFNFNEGILE